MVIKRSSTVPPPCPAIWKSGGGTCPPVPHGSGATDYDFIFVCARHYLQPTIMFEMEPKLNLKIIPQVSELVPLYSMGSSNTIQWYSPGGTTILLSASASDDVTVRAST